MRSFASKIDVNSVASARVGGYTPNPKLTFAELVRGYCLCAKPNEPRDYRFRKWLEWLGATVAWDITGEQVEGLLEALSGAGMANSTRNRELGDIKAIFNWAINEKRRSGVPLGFVSPVRNLKKLSEPIRRVHLSERQITDLLALAKLSTYRRMYGLILTALTSGARKGELMRMRWDNTDLDRKISEIGTDHKTGRYRTLILSDDVVAELRTYKRYRPDALIFCGSNPHQAYDERREWRRLRAELRLTDLHFHDLRHIAAARMLKAGASTLATSQVLGHADTRMLARRYGSLETITLKDVVEKAAGGLQ
ncbi:site-specific integrase [Luminiphilus sp.]|nr:site-specific integrase [Luminiphilus sp.]